MGKWIGKIFAVLFLLIAISLLLFNLLRDQYEGEKLVQELAQQQIENLAELIINSTAALPAAYRELSEGEKNAKHFSNLGMLTKDWQDKLLQKNATYALWRSGELIKLSGGEVANLSRNRALRIQFERNTATGKESFRIPLPKLNSNLFAIKTSKGYYIKIAPREGSQRVKDPWKNMKTYLAEMTNQPYLAYIITQRHETPFLSFPDILPGVIPLSVTEMDTSLVFGQILEIDRVMPGKNYLMRIGFHMDYFKPYEEVLRGNFIVNLLANSLAVIFLFLSIFLGRSMIKRGSRAREYEKLLNSITAWIIVLDKKNKIVFANEKATRYFGKSGNNIVEACFAELPALSEHISQETPMEAIEIETEDSHIRFTGRKLSEKGYYLVAGEDIGGEFKAVRQKQLEERLKAMNVLASGVAHEVRNPLNAISMIFQRLKFEFPPQAQDDEYKTLTATLGNEIGRLDMLINQFLSLTRPLKIKLETFVVIELFKELILVAEAEIKGRDIRIEYDVKPQALEMHSDRDLIKQVLINFVRNAGDALENRPNGLIRIFADGKKEGKLVLGVTDNGIGMDSAQKEDILNPFYTTKADGTGLGLSIVQKIVTQLDGYVEINSVKNIGSEFLIRFEHED